MQTIAVVDYGMGNIHSVTKALERVAENAAIKVTDRPADVLEADRVLFPGVGAIRDCMIALREKALDKALEQAIDQGKPVLAICVGLQALMRHSEENNGVDCMGVLPGQVYGFQKRFDETGEHDDQGQKLKVPHMGWSQVEQKQAHPMWEGIPQGSRFYFVHSYFAQLDESAQNNQDLIAATTDYGVTFVAAACRGNLFATQFHPEKSQRWGLQLLENFTRWNGN